MTQADSEGKGDRLCVCVCVCAGGVYFGEGVGGMLQQRSVHHSLRSLNRNMLLNFIILCKSTGTTKTKRNKTAQRLETSEVWGKSHAARATSILGNSWWVRLPWWSPASPFSISETDIRALWAFGGARWGKSYLTLAEDPRHRHSAFQLNLTE